MRGAALLHPVQSFEVAPVARIRWILCVAAAALALISAAGCRKPRESGEGGMSGIGKRLEKYAVVRLEADLSGLTEKERQMIPLLKNAARVMDELFWLQAYGDKLTLLAKVKDAAARRFVEINYGPWDRLDGNAPFLEGFGPKPLGANFYPPDMTREEFEAAVRASNDGGQALKSPYTLVRRDVQGKLFAQPYHEAYSLLLNVAARNLREAARLAEDARLKRYLELRAEALLTDNYQSSDLAWMEMKTNAVDIVIGPIETYEDRLFGYKAAYEAYVLVKDKAWSRRLARYAALLPDLQRELPVPEAYKKEKPGAESDLNAYDAIFYAGDANAGSKTIAINLPNDEQVQLKKGTRRLQLANAMRAKFERILVPLAGLVIAEDQRRHITFDAFFSNTMFHEVAHGLGVKHTLQGKETVRAALKDAYSAIEECKADVLGLYLIDWLAAHGELDASRLPDHYVTFLAGIFRSIRFGASSAHGVANLVAFHHLREAGAFTRDAPSGGWRVDGQKMKPAVAELAGKLLRLEGDGDYEAAIRLLKEKGVVGAELSSELQRLAGAAIPVDIVFEQD